LIVAAAALPVTHGAPRLARIEAHAYRYPVETPVRTSFGIMHDRPALFLRVEDEEGAVGWGEVWCNFPQCGAEHRARLVATVFAPLLEGREPGDPAGLTAELRDRTAVLAIQSGEPGPIHQCIAGLDIALWDLAARRAGEPLWRLLGGTSPSIPVYASGINPDRPELAAARCQAEGHRAFKLKVGFGEKADVGNLRAMRAAVGEGATLMVDANQAWDLAGAVHHAALMAPLRLAWIEEPLRADRPWPEWQALAKTTRVPLAAGENIAGAEAFEDAFMSRALGVVQPDVAKWGGISGCLRLARRILETRLRYCPHFLGGGIGLLASAHLLAAAGGDGLLEIDSNPNPLRTLTCGAVAKVQEGRVVLDSTPGLGAAPDADALRRYRVTP
jgi:L-alanine-DL-glutamate epimerase-like enolase superfamily enzyme